MIKYRYQPRARNEAAMRSLKEIALPNSQADKIARQLDEGVTAAKEAMESIHGGRWSASINHQSRFVLIAYDGE